MLKIAICDDLDDDRSRVADYVDEYIKSHGIDAMIYSYNHPDKMLDETETLCPHLYILDIVMPMITGIEAARDIRWKQKEAQIIFMTTEKSYALESFDVNPVNYLVKPVDKDKLFATLDIAIKHIDLEEEKPINLKVRGGYKTIYPSEIVYIEYFRHVVKFHLSNGEEVDSITLRIGFTQFLEENLEIENLVRCHESYVANLSSIDSLTKTEITTRYGDIIPISKSRYPEVSEKYLNYRLS